MESYFVVGDIHGKAGMLEELMTHWDGQSQLVFLGDLIDRTSQGFCRTARGHLSLWEPRIHVSSLDR